MARPKAKLSTGGGRSSEEYGIAVRFRDGSCLYYFVDLNSVDDRGRPLERWGRESQAARFADEAEALALASTMAVSAAVRGYEVVALRPASPKMRPHRARRPSSGTQRAG